MTPDLRNNKMYSLTLPASEIPSDTVVTKRTGQKEFVLVRRVRLFVKTDSSKNTDVQELTPAPGSVYLLKPAEDAAIEQYPGDTLLAVHFESLEGLEEFICEIKEAYDE